MGKLYEGQGDERGRMGSPIMEMHELTTYVIKNQDAIGIKKRRKRKGGDEGKKTEVHSFLNCLPSSFPDINTDTYKLDLSKKSTPLLEKV